MNTIRRRNVLIGPNDWQRQFGCLRLILLLGVPIAIGTYGASIFDDMDPMPLTNTIIDSFALFILMRPAIIFFSAVVLSWRYMIVPIATTMAIFLAAGTFVRDIYDLKHTRSALRYIIASMFGIFYPRVTIDKGTMQLHKHEENLIDKIGGPGKVMIEPGNAAMFRRLREPSEVSLTATYFLPPFDTVAQVVNLEEQQADRPEVTAMTRDGIQVVIRNIRFRYRIQHNRRKNGSAIQPTLAEPYPISNEVMARVAFKRSVQSDGLDKWNAAVERIVVGAITDFVAAHYIDFLTAPREERQNPRIEIRNDLFFRGIRRALDNLGAELLWADVGHVDIVDARVDDSRNSMWAAEWIDDANAVRAFGEAKTAAYLELGRAEAQAELIMSITDVLDSVMKESGGSIDIRKILLTRTAQVLDAMTETDKHRGKA